MVHGGVFMYNVGDCLKDQGLAEVHVNLINYLGGGEVCACLGKLIGF